MSRNNYRWQLGTITFRLVCGDLFDVPASAIVNSEQTDFILAGNEASVSGQLRRRFGKETQPQLDKQTGGDVLPPGTVLRTTGEPYSAIFHAGFHHPHAWLAPSVEDNGTEHLKVIRGCVRHILYSIRDLQLPSVAFPLVGAGIFGLDARLVAHNFFEEVLQFVAENPPEPGFEVWLVLNTESLFDQVLEAGVQAWLEQAPISDQWMPFRLGVPYIDLFEKQLIRVRSPQWAAWLHVRYVELVLGFAFFALAVADSPPKSPEAVVGNRFPLTFGAVREQVRVLARRRRNSGGSGHWSHFIAELLGDEASGLTIKLLNDDRNDIAHGRAFRKPEEIRADVERLLQPSRWKSCLELWGRPEPGHLAPWVAVRPDGGTDPQDADKNTGVFERWGPGERTYVIPWSGAYFAVPGA